MNRNTLLQKLPAFNNRNLLIEKNQGVYDIVNEVLEAHDYFAKDYDSISQDFYYTDPLDTFKTVFDFLKANVNYKVESEDRQTTKSPAALLATQTGDCKHYAGFIAGVLDSLRRKGMQIDWNYRFASYSMWDKNPQHVFVVARTAGKTYWIDPVLKSFNYRYEPSHYIDRKPKSYTMLYRMSGVEILPQQNYLITDSGAPSDALVSAVQLLLHYNIVNQEGQVNDSLLLNYQNTLSPQAYQDLLTARQVLQQQAIGGFFDTVWRGVKKVVLAPERGAFLSLVALNVFGWATKLHRCLYNDDGSYIQQNLTDIKHVWQDTFAGDFTQLESAIKNGSNRLAILGVVAAVPVAAWVAAATAIIGALTPIIIAALTRLGRNTPIPTAPPNTGIYNVPPGSGSGSGGISDFIQNNPLVVVLGGAAAAYFLTSKKAH